VVGNKLLKLTFIESCTGGALISFPSNLLSLLRTDLLLDISFKDDSALFRFPSDLYVEDEFGGSEKLGASSERDGTFKPSGEKVAMVDTKTEKSARRISEDQERPGVAFKKSFESLFEF